MNSQCTTPSITSSSSRSSELDSNLTQSSITSYTSNESSFSDFNLKDTSNELSDSECEDSIEEIDIDLSCPDCSRPRPNDRWCSFCESQKFLKNNWTSGNSYLDRIIRDSQLHATSKSDYLVWIDYNDIENIEYLARGGFGEVYYGIWINGPYKVVIYDENRKSRIEGKTPVALKLLYNSVNITADFIEELKMYFRCRNGQVLHCYGITQHKESNNYMLVMEYANSGDLRHYFEHNYHLLSWDQKLRILKDISLGLEVIHSENLMHRDLHSGNLLLHTLKDGTMRTFITDLGLCRPIDKPSKSHDVYGVLPYIAPEILRRQHFYTKSSDIYSFGIIMWEVLTGRPPFHDISHNIYLSINICDGKRPNTDIEGVPEWYIGLMKQCWDSNPKNRPNIVDIRLLIDNKSWNRLNNNEHAINLPQNRGDIRIRRTIRSHPNAVYSSRLLPKPPSQKEFNREINTDENSENLDYITRAFEESLPFD